MKKIKLIRENFKAALDRELMTEAEFAELIGVTRAWMNAISSNNDSQAVSKKTCRKILSAFNDKYKFEDIFYFIN